MKIIKDLLKTAKAKRTGAIIFAVIGICLIIISYVSNVKPSYDISNDSDYGSILETKTKEILESVIGTDTVEVMITFKNTYATYQRPASINTSVTLENVQQMRDYAEIPTPEIAGVMIACRNLKDLSEFETVKKAISVCLDVPTNKIYIIGGN